MSLHLDEINVGDIITVQDSTKNVIVAPVSVITHQSMMVEAFGTYITVAHRNRMGHLVASTGCKIVGHQPDLLGG